jgi:hypothetical protein
MLVIRKLADKSEGRRVQKYEVSADGQSVVPKLVNPDTPGEDHEPWPFAGIRVEGEVPAKTAVNPSFVTRGISEGWLSAENQRVVHKPAGPPDNEWASTHTFVQYETITLHTVDGDVVYNVVRNPDKDDDGSVSWVYELEARHQHG